MLNLQRMRFINPRFVSVAALSLFSSYAAAEYSLDYVEAAPNILSLEVVKGESFFEIFMIHRVPKDCYDARSFRMTDHGEYVDLYPILRRTQFSKPCSAREETLREKLVDLDPTKPSSQRIRVLGFLGWMEQKLAQP